jgi:hypothetical protein
LRSLFVVVALGSIVMVPELAHADYYENANGSFTVEPRLEGGWTWTASNGEGGLQPTKRDAIKAAKASLKKKPSK